MTDPQVLGRAPGVQGALPLVGRAAELAWLTGALHDAAGGSPRVCLVAGPAGIGKTRLLRELRAVARRSGATVCFGRAQQSQRVPYACFEPLLVRLAQDQALGDEIGGKRPEAGGLLRGAAPEAPAPASPEDAGKARQRVFASIAARTFEHARQRPLVLVLDDLHWSDSASLDLLAHLVFEAADAAESAPILIAGTFRPAEGAPAVAETIARVRREPICQLLELDGLGDRDVAGMLPGLGVERPAQQLVGAVQRLTQGNPLFVQEIVHHLQREHVLEERSGAVVARTELSDLDLPPVLSQVVGERLMGLDPDVRELLVMAAFLGDRFDPDVLAAVCGRDRDIVLALLDVARGRGLLQSEGASFEFHHGLLARVLAQEPSGPRRQEIHRRVAETLESIYADALESHVQDIAHHWIAAGPDADAGRVARFAMRASMQALRAYAWEEATRYAEAALAASERVPTLSARERAALHRTAAISHYRNMDPAPALDHFRREQEAHEAAGEPVGVAAALMEVLHTRYSLAPVAYGARPEEMDALEARLEALGPEELALRGRAAGILSEAYTHARDLATAMRWCDEAVRIGEETGDRSVLAHGLLARGWAELQQLEVEKAADTYRACLEAARRSGDAWIVQWPLQRLPIPLFALGRLTEAEAATRDALTLNRRLHDWADHSLTLGNLATLALARGRMDEVEAHAREALEMVRRTGYPWGAAMALLTLATARRLRGEFAASDDALGLLLEPGRVFPEVGPDVEVVGAVLRLTNVVAAGATDATAPRRVADLMALLRAVGLDLTSLGATCALVDAATEMGAADSAAAAAADLEPLYEHGVRFTTMGEYCLARILGRAAAAAGDHGPADEWFERALALTREVGAETEAVLTRLDQARAWAARGPPEHERARAAVRDVLPRLRALGMAPAERVARELAERLGAREAGTALPAERRLSRFERDLLTAITAGNDDTTIAHRLLVSPATVASACEALFARLGVDGREEAAAWAVEQGIPASSDDPTLRERARRRAFLPPPAPTSQLTLLVTDVVDFTETLQQRGEERAQRAIQAHNRILRECLERHLGREVQHTGDGLIAAFGSSAYAAECACAMQRELARAAKRDPENALRVRVGLHAGPVRREEDRLFGNVMNAAARICAVARGDEILCSEKVRQAAASTGLAFSERGPVELKGFETPYLLFRVRWSPADGPA